MRKVTIAILAMGVLLAGCEISYKVYPIKVHNAEKACSGSAQCQSDVTEETSV